MGEILSFPRRYDRYRNTPGKRVLVLRPAWLPGFFASQFDRNIGKEGIVYEVEEGIFSGLPIYSVLFEEEIDGKVEFAVGAYFQSELELIG